MAEVMANSAHSVEMQTIGNPLFSKRSREKKMAKKSRQSSSGEAAGTQVHVQALDEIVAVNSFFTVAVFIGLSLTNPSAQNSLVSTCMVGADLTKYLLIFEVVAFSSYLMSSLIAQGLKLLIVLLNSKDHPQPISARVNPTLLRAAMLLAALGTITGTVFLTLSIVFLIQIRLGLLSCDTSSWSKWAAIPMVTMVSTGLLTFISSAFYAFIT